VARVLISEVLARKAVFLARGGFPRSVHFVNPPPTEAVGRRPHRGRSGAARKGCAWGSPTEGGGFFAQWVRQICGSAPLGGVSDRARAPHTNTHTQYMLPRGFGGGPNRFSGLGVMLSSVVSGERSSLGGVRRY
jgi:hypothetical protein